MSKDKRYNNLEVPYGRLLFIIPIMKEVIALEVASIVVWMPGVIRDSTKALSPCTVLNTDRKNKI